MQKYRLNYNKDMARNKISMFRKKALKNNVKVVEKLNLEKEKEQKILDDKILEMHKAWEEYFTDLGTGYVEIKFRHN